MGQISQNIENYMKYDSWHVFYHFEQFRPKWATSGDFSTFAQMAWSNKKMPKC